MKTLTANGSVRGLVQFRRLLHSAMVCILVVLGMLCLTFLGSIGISKAYWGYFFSEPELLSEASMIEEVKSVVAFKTVPDALGRPALVPDTAYSLASRVEAGKKYGDDALEERILVALEQRRLLPADFSTTVSGLPELYPLLRNSGVLQKSSEGYDSSAQLSGIAVDAANKAGERCLLVGFKGGQLSNDHYPYYELIFRGDQGSQVLRLVRSQFFFYDAAGMEGFEWPVIWLFLSVPALAIGVPLFVVYRAIAKDRSEAPPSA